MTSIVPGPIFQLVKLLVGTPMASASKLSKNGAALAACGSAAATNRTAAETIDFEDILDFLSVDPSTTCPHPCAQAKCFIAS
jgi:hypothetical protein